MSPSNPFITVGGPVRPKVMPGQKKKKSFAAVKCNAVICWLLGRWARAAGLHFSSCSVAENWLCAVTRQPFLKKKVKYILQFRWLFFLACLLSPLLVLYVSLSLLAGTSGSHLLVNHFLLWLRRKPPQPWQPLLNEPGSLKLGKIHNSCSRSYICTYLKSYDSICRCVRVEPV